MAESEAGARRLPVYLVLDTSGSMDGEPIEAVRQGLQLLLSDLQTNPQALESVWLGVITFDSQAKELVPLTEIGQFRAPTLTAGGGTSLGEGLRALMRAVDRDVRKSIPGQQKGDWKPLVFIMTDGFPTDSWESAADELKRKRIGNVIACAAGPGADDKPLKRLTEIVVRLADTSTGVLGAFMKWVSASVTTTSQSVATQGDAAINLPAPPADQGIVIVP